MQLKVISSALNLRSEASSARGKATVVRTLKSGDLLLQLTPLDSWVKVRVIKAADAPASPVPVGPPLPAEGWVKRSLTAQASLIPWSISPRTERVNQALWDLTETYDAVQYKLGQKKIVDGSQKAYANQAIDCSGWMRFCTEAAYDAANDVRQPYMAPSRFTAVLRDHSDGQVVKIGRLTRQVVSGPDLLTLAPRAGILIGINNGDYEWEGKGRVFGIDHVVQTMRDPRSGAFFITQSSSSGGGVNRVGLTDWLHRMQRKIDAWRIHAVDPYAVWM